MSRQRCRKSALTFFEECSVMAVAVIPTPANGGRPARSCLGALPNVSRLSAVAPA